MTRSAGPSRVPTWIRTPLLCFFVTRLGIVLVAYLSGPLLPDGGTGYHLRPDNLLVDSFASRWDTGFFLDVARDGYWDAGPGKRFPGFTVFPVLPLLIRASTPLIGDPLLAGLLVSNLSLLGASLLLYRLAADELGDAVAGRAVFYLLAFPTSFFGAAIYSEPVLLVFATAATLLARRGQWAGAAAAGALASASRVTGVLVALLLADAWWRGRASANRGRRSWGGLLAIAATPLGLLAYMAYLRSRFGDPLAFLSAQRAWGRHGTSPLRPFLDLLHRPPNGWGQALLGGTLPVDAYVDGAFALLFLALGVALLVGRRWGEGAFVVAGTLVNAFTGFLASERRYVWVLFPAFVLLARWGERPWVDRLVATLSLLLLALFTALFTNWYWVA